MKVFIVGPARSGTSTLFFAIKSVADIPGYGESHLMPMLQRVVYNARVYWLQFCDTKDEILIKNFPVNDFEQHLFSFVRLFYERQYGHSWVDKTPSSEAVHGIDLIRRIFPDAKIICTKRNGLEVVRSRLIKFGEPMLAACREWTGAMEGVRQYSTKSKQVLLIDQADLAGRTEEVASNLANLLDDPRMAPDFAKFLRTNRIEESGFEDPTPLLSTLNWSTEHKLLFEQVCGEMMRHFGYVY